MSRLWNWCTFCGKRIETGEKCYGLPNGESVCTDCCVAENEGAAVSDGEEEQENDYAAEQLLDEIPSAKAVSLHDIYRVIAGHSYYHGDRILAALSCIAEGKEVNPVRPADVAPVVHGRWIYKHRHRGGIRIYEGKDEMGETRRISVDERYEIDDPYCSECGKLNESVWLNYCPNCGAMMDGEPCTPSK